MNKRIKELAEQADIVFGHYNNNEVICSAIDITKFAELIVKECALTAGLMEHEGRTGIGAQILDNYGVEE